MNEKTVQGWKSGDTRFHGGRRGKYDSRRISQAKGQSIGIVEERWFLFFWEICRRTYLFRISELFLRPGSSAEDWKIPAKVE